MHHGLELHRLTWVSVNLQAAYGLALFGPNMSSKVAYSSDKDRAGFLPPRPLRELAWRRASAGTEFTDEDCWVDSLTSCL